ncbi:SGNH/GDSL hydrolase family protein [Variovorax ureilyticus]|uniref:SGNH/GDSL hydrolase family protein n=1 Tax=Variovorax ureilyticus TaxID=1836198 RepID=UPI003D668EAC
MRFTTLLRAATRLASVTALALVCSPALAQYGSVDRIVVFGSSLSDTGNAFVWLSEPANQACGTRLNVPPYDALDDNLTPDGPYAKGGHHVTNGATWIEDLARPLALAGNARPALRHGGGEASNYAVFGARAVPVPCRFSLPEQVAAYLADFPQTSARTLVALEIGSNDVRDALVAAALGGQDSRPLLQQALGSLAYQVGLLQAYGARKFLFVNVPDIGKTPAVLQLDKQFPGLAGLATILSQAYNQGLAGVVQYTNASGAQARVLDVYTLLNTVVANPGTYGMTNTTSACVTPGVPPFQCNTPDSYVFWDGIHPTKAMHAIVGQQAIGVVSAP